MAQETPFQLEILVTAPVPGVAVAVQSGKGKAATWVLAQRTTSDDLCFPLGLKAALAPGEDVRFRGPFVQRDDKGPFVYLCWGGSAGDPATEVQRRTKVYLNGVTAEMVVKAGETGCPVRVSFAGRGRDGGPACATVPVSVHAPV